MDIRVADTAYLVEELEKHTVELRRASTQECGCEINEAGEMTIDFIHRQRDMLSRELARRGYVVVLPRLTVYRQR